MKYQLNFFVKLLLLSTSILMYTMTSAQSVSQENVKSSIDLKELIPNKYTDSEVSEKIAIKKLSSKEQNVYELKNGITVPTTRVDGKEGKKTKSGGIVYADGVHITNEGVVRRQGQVVRKLEPGENFSMDDLKSITKKSSVSPQALDVSTLNRPPVGQPDIPVSPSGNSNTPTVSSPIAGVSQVPQAPGIPKDYDEPQPVPVTTAGVPETFLAGAFYRCPDQIQVTARIVPDSNSSQNNDIWALNGDGQLSITESELDVSGGVYFPTCYYLGSRGERSIFTTLQVDRNVYKICRKNTFRGYSRNKHSFSCSPDEDWVNKIGNASLQNQEMDLDYQGTGMTAADIQYRTQNGQATLSLVNRRGALAILRNGEPRRGTCSTALDNPVEAIPQSELNTGVVVCYRTGLNRYGYLKISTLPRINIAGIPDKISFSYITYAKLD